MRLIGDGVVDREGVSGLASRLGYTPRHLTRVLSDELGAGPLAVARAQRAQTARLLLETTDRAGDRGGVRRRLRQPAPVQRHHPRGLRDDTDAACASAGAPARPPRPGTVNLRLTYRQPCDVGATLRFLAPAGGAGGRERSTAADSCARSTCRTGPATVRLSEGPPGAGYVRASLALSDLRDLTVAVARCRRLLDLDADPVAVDAVLGAGPLAGHVSGAARAAGARHRRRGRARDPRGARSADLGRRRAHARRPAVGDVRAAASVAGGPRR